jgi:dipeptidase
VRAEVQGRAVVIGSERFITAQGVEPGELAGVANRLAREGKTPLYAALDGRLAAVLAVSDPIKAEAGPAIAALRAQGLSVAMITGDHRSTAEAIGRAAGTQGGMNGGHCNPRIVFGTATAKDHIYNTPRAWYMYRYLDPADAENLTPESDDIPWCLEPENAVTVEDVDFLLGSHFEGTPYDPYGTQGTEESRHRYRPIGINRTGHMVAMQIRPYAPVESRSIMWISYGSGPFTAATPFYANVNDTPAYLRDTTPEVSTDCLYWTNRLIATLADAHFYETSNAVEGFSEDVRSFGHRLVERTDGELAIGGSATGAGGAGSGAGSAVGGSGSMSGAAVDSGSDGLASPTSVPARLAAANDEMAEYLRSRNTKLLGDVLYTSSNLMHNSFAMSDRWN